MNNHSTPSDDLNAGDLDARLRRSAGSESSAPQLSPELVTAASSRRAPRLINHGRATRAASVSMAAVAAVAVGSLVIANPFTSRDPLFTAAGGAAPSMEMSSLSDEARIALWVNYVYEAGPALSDDAGRGKVYQVQRAGSPEQVLREVAGALGVSGDVEQSQYFDPAYPTYVVGAEDGTASSVTVTWTGTGSWWFNNPGAYPEPVCETVAYEDENGEVFEYDECVQPPIAPEDSRAPSEADARSLAASLFATTGLEVAERDIRVVADEWQTTASANLTVDGVATAIEYAVAWSPTGEIVWATGHSIEVVERGEFDRAVERGIGDALVLAGRHDPGERGDQNDQPEQDRKCGRKSKPARLRGDGCSGHLRSPRLVEDSSDDACANADPLSSEDEADLLSRAPTQHQPRNVGIGTPPTIVPGTVSNPTSNPDTDL